MKLFGFYCLLTLLYIIAMKNLFHELHTSTTTQRRELQTNPMLLATTVFYVTVICKTHQLAQYFTVW